MSAYLYRLYSVQSFEGEKVAIYSCEGNYPDAQLLGHAMDIVEGNQTRKEILDHYDWMYGVDEVYPQSGKVNRQKLTYYTRLLKRSKKVIDENKDVKKAIFVYDTNPRNWRGEQTLYENESFGMIKTDTPEYTSCKPIGTINI